MPFDVHVNGADHRARAFSEPRMVDFPSPVGPWPAYLFPFSDQVLYPRTLGARTARSRLALDPPQLARLLAVAVRTGAARILAGERLRRALARRRRDRNPRHDARFALRVDVARDGRATHATLVGTVQAEAAAVGAAGLARSLLDGEVTEPGAWMPEQVVDPARFFAYLERHGFGIAVGEV
jgi:saccharopine dehydrogenase-like NADP-dependent oxidoreductase